MKVQAFRIHVEEDLLRDLRQRLAHTRWPDALERSGWDQGADLSYLKELAGHWLHRYDWRARERELNLLPQFRAEVQGLGIHFVHLPCRTPPAPALIVTHGWPGSFAEMTKIAPLLAARFHVVIPSIPGYGFSDRPRVSGMTNRRVAALWAELMSGLGYERFLAQGGDWGAGISTWMALDHPGRLTGLHLNYVPGSYSPHTGAGAAPLTDAERRFQEEAGEWVATEGGYGHQQKTKPQSLAFGLNDSPAGLAAWIVEKLRGWSDCGGDVESRFSKDDLLTHVMIYWATQTIGSSMRLYLESASTPLRLEAGRRVETPTAVAVFPKEAPSPPREWVERGYNLVRWTPMPRGGHFAAWEEPELLAADILEFSEELGPGR